MASRIQAPAGWVGAALCVLATVSGLAQPVGTAFTYQGRLTDNGSPANGSYDLRFILYDAASAGSQVGSSVTVSSVTVSNGLFTVSLDFGSSAFAGSKRWLEIGARPGGSGGAFTTLSPRQELQPTPQAVRASDAATVAGLACEAGEVVKWSGGGWSCGTDIDTNSGGTVQTVATGVGLTGGPVTLTGTISVATGGITSGMLATGAVTSAKIASGAVGSAQINTAQVQARVGGTCPVGQYLRGINSDGTVVCSALPQVPVVITTVDDSMGSVGRNTSIAIGTDGLPVISYLDDSWLKVAKCANPACTGASTITTVDREAVVTRTSIAIGTDGYPVISYNSSGALTVAKCANAACTGASTITPVDDPVNYVGYDASIAIGADALPVISYRDQTANTLKVAKCANAACTGASTITVVDDPLNSVGHYTSIALGADGLPVISYHDSTAHSLKVAKCVNAACTGASTITTVDDPTNGVGYYTSLAIGAEGLPVISYRDNSAGTLKVAKCLNPACTGASTITVVDNPSNFVGEYTSIAIGTDGLPVISYYDSTAGALKATKCLNAACTGTSAITTVDDPVNDVGQYTSIAIGADGLPVISYHDATAGALKVARCGTRSCE